MTRTHIGRRNHHDASLGDPEKDVVSGEGPTRTPTPSNATPAPLPALPKTHPILPSSCRGAILTQIGLDSRTPSVVLILGEFCQFLVGNPSPLNSRQNFWGLVTWAWCGLGM